MGLKQSTIALILTAVLLSGCSIVMSHIHSNRGKSFYEKGDYENAIREFNESIRLDPSDWWPYHALGWAYGEIGDYDNAIKASTEAVKLKPSNWRPLNTCGWLYAQIGEYEKAVADSDKSIEIDPNSYNYDTRGFAFFGMGEYEKALADYNKAIELLSSDDPVIFSHRGDLHLKLGNYYFAISDYNTALQFDPDYSKASDGLAIALARKEMGAAPIVSAEVNSVDSIAVTSDSVGEPVVPAAINSTGRIVVTSDTAGTPVVSTAINSTGRIAAVGPRYALVIGNADYTDFNKLPNTVNDARDVASSLEKAGFTVNLLLNADRRGIQDAILNFRDNLGRSPNSTEGFVWYAGHGVQHNGENYLIPVNSGIKHVDYLEMDAVPLTFLMNNLRQAGNKTNIVVLDACRNNPLAGSRGGSRGLTVVGYEAIPQSTLILYSTAANAEAADGAGNERNSPFARAFLNNINKNIEFEQMFKAIVRDTLQMTNNTQAPTRYGLIYDDFYF